MLECFCKAGQAECIYHCVVEIAPITASTPRWKLPPFRLTKAPSIPLSSRIVLLVFLAASAPAPQAKPPWKRYCTTGIRRRVLPGRAWVPKFGFWCIFAYFGHSGIPHLARLCTEVPYPTHVYNNIASLSTSRTAEEPSFPASRIKNNVWLVWICMQVLSTWRQGKKVGNCMSNSPPSRCSPWQRTCSKPGSSWKPKLASND